MIQTQQPPWGQPPGGYGPPPGGGGYGPPPGGGGYGGPPGGGGYGGPPGGGGYGGPPPGGGGYGGPPPGGGGFGQPPYMGQVPGQPPGGGGMQTDPMAIISLVTGIVSMPTMFCCSFFGIPISLTAIVLGLVSISKINQQPNRFEGKGMAIGGIATGAVGLLLFGLFFALGLAGALLRRF